MRFTAFVVFAACLAGPMRCTSDSDSSLEKTSESPETKVVLTDTSATESNDPLVPPIVLDPVSIGSEVRLDEKNTLPLDVSHDLRAIFEPHGSQVCASGCAASSHPTGELSDFEFDELKRQFALGPMDETNKALETLLYYGRQTSQLLETQGTFPLDVERIAFLKNELCKTHALVSFRIVDENGKVRTHMPPTRVPLDRRHVFDMEVENLPDLITSGTVKRVGLHHLWTRL